MHADVSMRKTFENFIKLRLLLPTIAVFFLAAAFTGYYGVKVHISRNESIAEFAAYRLEEEIAHLNLYLSSLAESLQGKSLQETALALHKALHEGYFEGFYLVDHSGAIVLAMPSSYSLSLKFPIGDFTLARNSSGRTSFYLASETPGGLLIAAVNPHQLKTIMALELAPIYKGQVFLSDNSGLRFPLFPPELEEKALGSVPPLRPGRQIYISGDLFAAGIYPLSNFMVVARSSLLKAMAPFLAWGFVPLFLGALFWYLAMHSGYRHLEKKVIAPLEMLLRAIEKFRDEPTLPYLPTEMPGVAAEINQLFSAFREAQTALAHSEKEKSLILEGVSDLVTFQDPELKIRWANKAAGDSVGKKPEDLIGKHCYEIWQGRSSPCPGCPVVETMKTGSYQQSEVTSPDGRRWFIRARAVKDENGKVIGAIETTTDITQIRRAEEEERALAQISHHLNALNVKETFPALARTLSQLMNCQRIVLLFFNEETESFRILSLISDPPVPELYDGLSFNIKNTGVTELLLRGEVGCTTNLEEFASFPVEKALVRAGYRSRIVLPLSFEGKLIGALALLSTRPEPFWEGRKEFLQRVSEVLSIALARDQAYRNEVEERQFTQTLADTAVLILKASSPEEIFNVVMEKLEQIIQGDAFNLMLIIGDYAQVVSHKGYEKWGVEDKIAWLHFPLSQYNNLQLVHERGEPLLIHDTSCVPWWVQLEGFEWIKSYMCAPLKFKDQVIGFLNVDGARPYQFTTADLQHLKVFADHISLALGKAKMLMELEEYSEQMERLVQERTEHLLARQAWLEAIFKGTNDGLILLNPQGKILEMNPLAWAWLHQITSPEEAESLRGILSEIVRNAQSYPEVIKELEAGTLFIKAIPLEPSYPGSLAILHDISHLKAMDKMKTKLITDLSHELRTPLAALKLYSELIQMSPPEKHKDYIDQILQLIDHMTVLINNIIEVAKLEAGKVELMLKPLELNQFVKNTVEKHQGEAKKRSHQIEVRLSADNPTVMADSHRLEQVLDNLVCNAIRYTPDGGHITISTDIREEEDRLWGVIEVADNGIGIPEEELPHIFERFYRGEEARSRGVSGSGLGLSITKELVELHGGKIKVKSKVGEGSTFTVMLPLIGKIGVE